MTVLDRGISALVSLAGPSAIDPTRWISLAITPPLLDDPASRGHLDGLWSDSPRPEAERGKADTEHRFGVGDRALRGEKSGFLAAIVHHGWPVSPGRAASAGLRADFPDAFLERLEV